MEQLLKSLINKKVSITYSQRDGDNSTIAGILREVTPDLLKIEVILGFLYINRKSTVLIDLVEFK